MANNLAHIEWLGCSQTVKSAKIATNTAFLSAIGVIGGIAQIRPISSWVHILTTYATWLPKGDMLKVIVTLPDFILRGGHAEMDTTHAFILNDCPVVDLTILAFALRKFRAGRQTVTQNSPKPK